MKDFRTLKVWEKSHQFTLQIYSLSRNFPKDELFGLVSQIRRASSSIAINIAEGCGRGSDSDFARFLQMSMGSASETEYLILLCADLDYFSQDVKDKLLLDIQEIKKMLSTLIIKIRNK
ncbi:MAG: four helix bundle protein [Bacteroidales bacterium]|nr:four helix bundle protein [Bacteroidales bacterium]